MQLDRRLCASLGSPLCFSGFWTPVKTLFHPEYFRGTPSGLLPCLQPLSVENLMCLGSGRFRVSCLSTAPGSWKSNVPLADLSQVSPRFVVASSALTGSERLWFYGLCIIWVKNSSSSHFPLSSQTDVFHVSYLLSVFSRSVSELFLVIFRAILYQYLIICNQSASILSLGFTSYLEIHTCVCIYIFWF